MKHGYGTIIDKDEIEIKGYWVNDVERTQS